VGGVGLRRVGLLESGAVPVKSDVPRFAPDGRTQLGTGFNEFTADGRVTWRPSGAHELTLASNAYRQFDAPRTDQCPPAFARSDECLTYTEQFRTLTFAAWKGHFTDVDSARVTLSWQRQHEVREGARPASFVLNTGRDTVDTLGASLALTSRSFAPAAGLSLELSGGADAYVDLVDSRSFVSFTDIAVTRELSRGQYLTRSTSLTGGAFAQPALGLGARVTLRGGGRLGVAASSAPGDEASGTAPVRGAWVPLAGHLGVEWRPVGPLTLLANVGRSFRAPNLDDLTSRQQTGPGFQFENPDLQPERGTSVELGARMRVDWLSLDAWVFQTWLDDAMVKQPRDVSECPVSTPQCSSAWFRYQLENVPGSSEVRGVEGSARLRLPSGFGARATAAYAWGQGPSRVPLSRIPPANGTVELTWRHEAGLVLATAVRWAGPQTRLSLADLSDARIPPGGTPGYAVVEVRASVRLAPVLLTLVLENLLDTAWRAHGSSINGPGRGWMMLMSFRAP
jgi:iron complex outermembrane receptor protein/hemoglobin/transferrin/lactoferrin receptor protein